MSTSSSPSSRHNDDIVKVYGPTWAACCALCGLTSELMKKCPHCNKQKYCTKLCLESDWSRHKKTCVPRPAPSSSCSKATSSPAPGPGSSGVEESLEYMGEILPFLESCGLSSGTARIVVTACSKGSSLPVADHVAELTQHPLGRLIGSRFFRERDKVGPALDRAFRRFEHPFLRYGGEVLRCTVEHYSAHPEQVQSAAASFAPPTNIDQWFSSEHVT